MSERTIVVGGGPAGLAVAAMLGRGGTRPLVLERGPEVGAGWRTRYERLHLHTVRWLSGLPGHPIPRRYGKWPSRDRVCDYLREYAEHHGLDVRCGVEVQRIDRGWRLETSTGPFEAGRVIVATGYNGEPVVPDWPGKDAFPGRLVHSSDYRAPRRAGAPEPGDRHRAHEAPAEVVLSDGSRPAPDAIVAGTGFRPGLEPLVGHLGVLDERGRPIAQTPLPGLHFVGFTVTLGGLMRKVGIEARELAGSLAA